MDSSTKDVAQHHIKVLFNLAGQNAHTNEHLAQRYVQIARKIAMASRIHLAKSQVRICRHCKHPVLSGSDTRVRIRPRREPHIVMTCMGCGEQTRIPLKRRRPHAR